MLTAWLFLLRVTHRVLLGLAVFHLALSRCSLQLLYLSASLNASLQCLLSCAHGLLDWGQFFAASNCCLLVSKLVFKQTNLLQTTRCYFSLRFVWLRGYVTKYFRYYRLWNSHLLHTSKRGVRLLGSGRALQHGFSPLCNHADKSHYCCKMYCISVCSDHSSESQVEF